MHGHIHLSMREFVIATYGRQTWDTVLKETGLDDDNDFMLFHYYQDPSIFKMMDSLKNLIGMDQPIILEELGKYFYTYACNHGYDRMMKTLGKDFYTFVHNLDMLHSLLALTYKGMRPPQFKCERKQEKLIIHVFTVRPTMYILAIGLLKEAAKQIFDADIDVKLIEKTTENIADNRYKEHAILEVDVVNEKKVLDVVGTTTVLDCAAYDIEMNNDIRVVTIQQRSLLLAIPYSVIFDDNMLIKGAGLHLRALCSDLEKPDTKLHDLFEIKEPSIKLAYDSIIECSNSFMYFFLQLKGSNNNKEEAACPILRGHMVPLQETKQIAFLGSPFFESISDLLKARRFLHIIPQDQIIMEMVFMNEQRRADVEISKTLDETTSAMKKLTVALAEEKKKTDALLYEMLPVTVANQLRDGKSVTAEKHDCVSILFSDIVLFTNMAAMCEPMQIVTLLNHLFMRFDQLSTQHNVYKVETIGDAYMVVAGVPEAIDDHAHRIADMAVDMIAETSKVPSPITHKPIQIRVGIHTGPVVSGVVGTKMPRYCLFGDTVNTASRMESHGLPGRVHISDTTYRHLTYSNFDMEARGEIEVKGKGLMQTYFINKRSHDREVKNTTVSFADTNGGPKTEFMSATTRDARYTDDNHVIKDAVNHVISDIRHCETMENKYLGINSDRKCSQVSFTCTII